MMKKKSTFLKDWEDTRKMGRTKYSFAHGSIFGVIVGSFTILVSSYANPSASYWKDDLWVNFFVFIGGGILGYFLLIWPINEYYFRRYHQQFKPENKTKKK
jgi:hypothetical protein